MNDSEHITVYTIESLVQLTGVDETRLELYRESGLIRPAGKREDGEQIFNDEAVYRVRRIEFLRETHGVNLAGIRMIFDLLNELDRLREETRFLRS